VLNLRVILLGDLVSQLVTRS